MSKSTGKTTEEETAVSEPTYEPPTRMRFTPEVVVALQELAANQDPPPDLTEKGATPMFVRRAILHYRDIVLGRVPPPVVVCPVCKQVLESTADGWRCAQGHGGFTRPPAET